MNVEPVVAGVLGVSCIIMASTLCFETLRMGEEKASSPQPTVIVVNGDTTLPPDVARMTLALVNKNPLNVKGDKTTWQGQVGVDKRGFAIFSRWEYGVRAAAFVLKNYSQRHKLSTLKEIIYRFSDTDQEEYIDFLSKRMKLGAEEKFDVIRRLPDLLRHMARFEAGCALPEELFIPYDILEHI